MRYIRFLAFVVLCILACDDGDVITVELEFDGELERCDNDVNQFIVYDEIDDPAENLYLVMPRNDATEALFVTAIPESDSLFVELNGNSWRFIYRTYNTLPDLCDLVGDSDVTVITDDEADSGEVYISTTFIDFDDDGIPNADEGADPNGDGDYSDSQDTDGDGIFDYIDQDDDNDNVLTADEDDNDDGDNNPFTNARDTDNDTIPDYLDNDDDGDDVLTIDEDENQNQNLFDDFDPESENPNTPRFLNSEADIPFDPADPIDNNYTREYSTRFVLTNINLGVISYERLVFGTYITTVTNPE